MDKEKCVGAIVCKLDMHKKMVRRGYIAMLAVDADYRRRKIGKSKYMYIHIHVLFALENKDLWACLSLCLLHNGQNL